MSNEVFSHKADGEHSRNLMRVSKGKKKIPQSARQFCASLSNEFLLKKYCYTKIYVTGMLLYSILY